MIKYTTMKYFKNEKICLINKYTCKMIIYGYLALSIKQKTLFEHLV